MQQNSISINGNIHTNRGQLGLVLYDNPIANIDLNSTYNKFYNKYVLTPTLNINCTLPTIGTVLTQVGAGYEVYIKNSSTFNITVLDMPVSLSNFTIRPNGYIHILAKSGSPNVWQILSENTSSISVNSNTGAPSILATDQTGDLYSDETNGVLYIFNGIIWEPLNNYSLVPNEYTINYATRTTLTSLIANDPAGTVFGAVVILTNVYSEGTITSSNTPQFTPVPRLNTSAIFIYRASKNNLTAYGTCKINVDLSYTLTNMFIAADGTATLKRVNATTGAITNIVPALPGNVNNIAGNRLDALVYNLLSGSTTINAYDYILNTQFTLLDTATAFSSAVASPTALGFDNTHSLLYIALPGTIVQVGLMPYNRYGAPGSQIFNGYVKTGTLAGMATVNDLAIEDVSGIVYLSGTNGGAATILVRYDFTTNTMIQTATPGVAGPLNLAFGNDGILYVTNNATIYSCNTSTLALTVVSASVSTWTDLASPLYNM